MSAVGLWSGHEGKQYLVDKQCGLRTLVYYDEVTE